AEQTYFRQFAAAASSAPAAAAAFSQEAVRVRAVALWIRHRLGNVWAGSLPVLKYGGRRLPHPLHRVQHIQAMPRCFTWRSAWARAQQAGCIQVWTCHRLARGIGVAQCLLGIGMFYYNVMVGWCIFFFFNSFTAGELPWMTCGQRLQHAMVPHGGQRGLLAVHQSPNIETLGRPRFVLVACIFIAYAIIFFALWRGIKSSGKVVYITATMPVLLLVILLINGVQLPGATKGIDYYIRPDVSKIDLF
uniref:Aa_trans domain-containing protein n=1 Tax=Macrostomum lignano TaxID=282301 RepID=A0A1I8F6A0_9PLAT